MRSLAVLLVLIVCGQASAGFMFPPNIWLPDMDDAFGPPGVVGDGPAGVGPIGDFGDGWQDGEDDANGGDPGGDPGGGGGNPAGLPECDCVNDSSADCGTAVGEWSDSSVEDPDAPDGGSTNQSGTYYDTDGDGEPDCAKTNSDCNTPQECVCEHLEAIREAMEKEEPALTTPELTSFSADADEDGCPDGIDPEPHNPDVGCFRNPGLAEHSVDLEKYDMPEVSDEVWTRCLEFEWAGQDIALCWGARPEDMTINGTPISIVSGLETIRVVVRTFFLSLLFFFGVSHVVRTLRQY